MTHEEKLQTINTLSGLIHSCNGIIETTKDYVSGSCEGELHFAVTITASEAAFKAKTILKSII